MGKEVAVGGSTAVRCEGWRMSMCKLNLARVFDLLCMFYFAHTERQVSIGGSQMPSHYRPIWSWCDRTFLRLFAPPARTSFCVHVCVSACVRVCLDDGACSHACRSA